MPTQQVPSDVTKFIDFVADSDNTGPVNLTLTQRSGVVVITVDRNALRPYAISFTRSPLGSPAAQAVERTSYTLTSPSNDMHILSVVVPDIADSQTHRGVAIQGPVSVGGSVSINADGPGSIAAFNLSNVNTGDSYVSNSSIETWITLPSGSSATVHGGSAKVSVLGHILSLRTVSGSGAVQVDTVSDLDHTGQAGKLTVNNCTNSLYAETASGKVEVLSYSGSSGTVTTQSGSAEVAATPLAQGRFYANTTSGKLTITGSSKLLVDDRVHGSGKIVLR